MLPAWHLDELQLANGILTSRGTGVGAVLFMRQPTGQVLLIQKAPRPGYEFSHLFAMPGGMCRLGEHGPSTAAIALSLKSRVVAETGIRVAATPAPLPMPSPPVTSYLARGTQRNTLVLPFTAPAPTSTEPKPTDPSIASSGWHDPILALPHVTPANRLILGFALWPSLTQTQQNQLRPDFKAALERCEHWAEQVGRPRPTPPWGHPDTGPADTQMRQAP